MRQLRTSAGAGGAGMLQKQRLRGLRKLLGQVVRFHARELTLPGRSLRHPSDIDIRDLQKCPLEGHSDVARRLGVLRPLGRTERNLAGLVLDLPIHEAGAVGTPETPDNKVSLYIAAHYPPDGRIDRDARIANRPVELQSHRAGGKILHALRDLARIAGPARL